eukprot:12964441-Alexandrium_andersonii.AAC.1
MPRRAQLLSVRSSPPRRSSMQTTSWGRAKTQPACANAGQPATPHARLTHVHAQRLSLIHI